MKNFMLVAISLVILPLLMQAQQDTVIYDSETGNYIFQYLRENVETGERDSLVRITFVPATKIDPSVNAQVEYIKDSNLYVYHYKIANGKSSKQKLRKFILEFGNNLDITDRSTQKWHSGRYYDAGKPLNKYRWSGNQGLEPTWTKEGFALGSSGLPGIGRAYFQARAAIPSFPYGMPWEMDSILSELEIFPANHIMRQTIVPFPILTPFVSLTFLDSLISYTRQSITLGWLKAKRDDDCDDDETSSDGIVKNIEKRIEKAKKELVKGDSAKARKELEKLVKKVEKLYKETEESEKGKHKKESVMTSEAYALLKYNAEYLIDRLPSKKEKEEKEKN